MTHQTVSTLRHRRVGALHIFLRRHAPRTRVSALSGAGRRSASPGSVPPICVMPSASRRACAPMRVGTGAPSS